MSRRWILVVTATMAMATAMPATAHENGVYEALHHIPIGRVFLSSAQRTQLDRYRNTEPAATPTDVPLEETVEAKPDRPAAGFIMSNSGTKHVWADGDFVKTSSRREVHFPGDVEVERTSASSTPDDTTDEAAVGDEEE